MSCTSTSGDSRADVIMVRIASAGCVRSLIDWCSTDVTKLSDEVGVAEENLTAAAQRAH
jgi:hypothetical protein